MRGEYIMEFTELTKEQGSPPLARGILCSKVTFLNLIRITPACAGNTHLSFENLQLNRDHPRLRGEYYTIPRQKSLFKGSPPLARGILEFGETVEEIFGITPACAGNTDSQLPESC